MPVGYSVYREVDSPIHDRLDPRTKLAWLGALFALALCFNHPAFLGALNLGVLAVARTAKLRLIDLRPYLLMAGWLLLLSVAVWPAYIPEGTALGRVVKRQWCANASSPRSCPWTCRPRRLTRG